MEFGKKRLSFSHEKIVSYWFGADQIIEYFIKDSDKISVKIFYPSVDRHMKLWLWRNCKNFIWASSEKSVCTSGLLKKDLLWKELQEFYLGFQRKVSLHFRPVEKRSALKGTARILSGLSVKSQFALQACWKKICSERNCKNFIWAFSEKSVYTSGLLKKDLLWKELQEFYLGFQRKVSLHFRPVEKRSALKGTARILSGLSMKSQFALQACWKKICSERNCKNFIWAFREKSVCTSGLLKKDLLWKNCMYQF